MSARPDMAEAASGSAGGALEGAAGVSLRDAYRHCEAVTRSQAGNFYWGIRLLPRERRQAMCAVYAFARRVDDIGDGTLAEARKLRGLEAEAEALARLPASPGADPVMIALADAYVRFPLPPDALPALIEGVRMDVEGAAYESFDELVLYCRRVAGAIGRACLSIFRLRDPEGTDRAHADALADDLGVALQLTNILRDLREDAENGRVYLPAEDLWRFGVIAKGSGGGAEAIASGARGTGAAAEWVDGLVRFEADRAQHWFGRGIALASLLDRQSAACVLAMAGIYRRVLERIAADPERVLRERVSLSPREKALVATRSLLGAGAPSGGG
jgi:15-cis-phytoene synthase